MTVADIVGTAAGLPRLSVIVPALNEAAVLPALLGDLARQRGVDLEVLIGDGGSVDGSREVAQSHGAVFVVGGRGRGAQMNEAVTSATAPYLLFLHADSRLEDPDLLANGLAALRRAEKDHPRVAGHFRLRFSRRTGGGDLLYRYMEAKTGLNRPHTTNGDQGLLLSRTFFDQLGGFDDSLPFLEDQRIAARIRTLGCLVTLPGVLCTSARRFESEGLYRRYLLMGIMMGMYAVGEERFFHRAPGVYRLQEATGQLRLWPFFRLLWTMVRHDWGAAGTATVFFRLGRLVRENAWQPLLAVDVCMQPLLGAGRTPLLRFHDRILAPFLNFRLVDILAGLGCFCGYMMVLAPICWLLEGRDGGDRRGRREGMDG